MAVSSRTTTGVSIDRCTALVARSDARRRSCGSPLGRPSSNGKQADRRAERAIKAADAIHHERAEF